MKGILVVGIFLASWFCHVFAIKPVVLDSLGSVNPLGLKISKVAANREINKCLAPVKLESCQSPVKKWFFNHATGNCHEIKPGKCLDKTSLGFDSLVACNSKCAQPVNLITADCNKLPEVTDSRAFFTRFYYDPVAKDCKEFVYGGGEGNLNRFRTPEDCKNYCLH